MHRQNSALGRIGSPSRTFLVSRSCQASAAPQGPHPLGTFPSHLGRACVSLSSHIFCTVSDLARIRLTSIKIGFESITLSSAFCVFWMPMRLALAPSPNRLMHHYRSGPSDSFKGHARKDRDRDQSVVRIVHRAHELASKILEVSGRRCVHHRSHRNLANSSSVSIASCASQKSVDGRQTTVRPRN